MKRFLSVLMLAVLCLAILLPASAENNVDAYYEKIQAGSPWSKLDYNVTYQKSAKNVLPYCSWKKGSNENGNGMLRRFFPKGTDFEKITEEELQQAENWVNSYPRKILGYKTADEVYAAA